MSCEPLDDLAQCTYQLIADCVHVFTLHTSTQASLEVYRRLWDQHLPDFWRNSAHFDGTLRVILVYESTEAPPFGYIYQQGRQAVVEYADAPKRRIAFVIPPIPNFIKGVETYADLTGETDDIVRRFFYTDEYDEALTWVMEHV